MPPIKFFYMPESPPCRAVEMVANIVGVKLDKQYVNLFKKDHLKDDYVKLNPLHKVPFIIDEDLHLNESRAIMTYLATRYGADNHPYLYPKDPKERAQIDALLYFDMGTLFQSAATLFRPMLFGKPDKLDEGHEQAFKDALHYLDHKLGENGAKRFISGNHYTVADVSIAATLTFPVACGYDLHKYKQIVAYIERLKSAIPNYSEINGEPTENMRKFIQSKREEHQQQQ